MMWEEGLGGKGYTVLQALHLQALNHREGIREVYLEEVIPELGFEGWVRKASRRKAGGGSFIQGEGYKKAKMPRTLLQGETELKAWYLILRKWDMHTEHYPNICKNVYPTINS